ncbi:heat stress transcription factor B-4 [Humulus lupulus]|uniref:heat stress transcription factor B-4 n=1 Tax=Humulus lupulus TaxID=3486 RepID=UPI002B414B41|nr:heat stress transcription factor B-4 [Humulus lupulus]
MALMLDNCEGILLSLDSHKSVPAPFLTKTYQLVDDPATDHIVSWGEDDTTFVVWRPPEFARDLLPNYFKHNNFSSFVRQLNTYGFRKIVPDRWEFANEFFKKGEKHLLCEIHRRKTAQPQVTALNHLNHHHHHHHQYPHSSLGVNGPSFFTGFSSSRLSLSPASDSDDNPNWCDSPARGGGTTAACAAAAGVAAVIAAGNNFNTSSTVTALSEDNERLRRSNSMLMSELAHMRKLYNDIIYFVQNHVKPVAPSNSYNPSSLLVCNAPVVLPSSLTSTTANHNGSSVPKVVNNGLGYYYNNPKPQNSPPNHHHHNQSQQPITSLSQSNTTASKSSVTIFEEPTSNFNGGCKTKLFGVPLHSKKRLHPEYGSNNINISTKMDTNKARLVLEKDDLGLNLMPPSTC